MAAAAAAGGAASFSVRRGPGGRPTRLRLPLSATSAEAVTWMVGNLVPVKLSLTGALVGWYRLSNSRGRVGHNVLMSALDVNEELSLELVENQTLFCDLLVEQNGARSLSPCGSAVPVGSLTDHLCAWMGLPAGAYTLLVNDVDVGPYAILADLPAPARGEVHRLRLVGPR
jgi:hypothetical protein